MDAEGKQNAHVGTTRMLRCLPNSNSGADFGKFQLKHQQKTFTLEVLFVYFLQALLVHAGLNALRVKCSTDVSETESQGLLARGHMCAPDAQMSGTSQWTPRSCKGQGFSGDLETMRLQRAMKLARALQDPQVRAVKSVGRSRPSSSSGTSVPASQADSSCTDPKPRLPVTPPAHKQGCSAPLAASRQTP
eukprot:631378-Amphidinium_carterae.5